MLAFLAKLFSPLGAMIAGGLAVVVVLGLVHHAGYAEAEAKCNAAALTARLATAQRDAAVAKIAAQTAAAREAELARDNESITKKVRSYEDALAREAAGGRCALSDADARRLRGFGGADRRGGSALAHAP